MASFGSFAKLQAVAGKFHFLAGSDARVCADGTDRPFIGIQRGMRVEIIGSDFNDGIYTIVQTHQWPNGGGAWLQLEPPIRKPETCTCTLRRLEPPPPAA